MNVNAAISVQTIVPMFVDTKKSATKSGFYARIAKVSAPMLSCTAHDMNLVSELISRVSILSQTNERFPLVKMAGISFTMLSSVDAPCSRFDYFRLPMDNTKGGSKTSTTKLHIE